LYDRTVDVHSEADSWRLPSCGTDVHAQLATSQALAALDALLDRLSGEARELFVQRFLEHRSYSEIAPSLVISEAGARKRVPKLRRPHAGHGEGPGSGPVHQSQGPGSDQGPFGRDPADRHAGRRERAR